MIVTGGRRYAQSPSWCVRIHTRFSPDENLGIPRPTDREGWFTEGDCCKGNYLAGADGSPQTFFKIVNSSVP